MEHQKRIERSVDSLQRLYTGIVALALANALTHLVLEKDRETVRSWVEISGLLPAFIAFLIILVPFVHGMNRHLDDCYLGGRFKHPWRNSSRWALLIDFFVFFGEAVLLFAISCVILQPALAFQGLGVLLLIDVVWAFAAWAVHYSGSDYPNNLKGLRRTPLAWATVNLTALVTAWGLTCRFSDADLFGWLSGGAIVRTLLDYLLSWGFYFPVDDAADGD